MRIYLSIIIISFFAYWSDSYSAPVIYRPTNQEVEAAAKPCLPGWSGVPINDKYTCPVWDISSNDGLGLSKERIECSIQIALSLEAIDKKSATWIKQLQTSREKDVNNWIKDIEVKTRTAEDSFSNQFEEVCSLTWWTISDNGKWIWCAKTTDFFPETQCRDITSKKVVALQNMGYILASKWIGKSFQNDKDKNLDAIKSAYTLINDKWNLYKRTVWNAVSKFTAYIKQVVK